MAISLKLMIIGIVSLIALIISADYVLKSISSFAKKIGISDYLIGLLVVSIGTSLPELTTAITGSAKGYGNLILGNILGANILDITLVLGIMAIVGVKLKTKSKVMGHTIIRTMSLIILPLILTIDGIISRFDGIVLILAFLVYIYLLWKKEGTLGKIKKDIPMKHLYKEIFIFGFAVSILLLSAFFVVNVAQKIAYEFNIAAYIVGLTILAVGTTLPELLISLKSIRQGHKHVGVGNLVGSVVVNVSLILGIAAVINPIIIKINTFLISVSFMIMGVFVALLFLRQKEITWKEGIGLIMIYATFLITQLV